MAPNGPGWKVRVVPNRFPALKIEGELDRKAEGIYDLMNGIGAHEVVIETPEHARQHRRTSPTRSVTEVLFAFKARMLDLRNDQRFRYILLFKNQGQQAGASHGAPPLPAHRAAGHAAPGAGRDRRGAPPLRAPRALHLLRHGGPGAQGPRPAGLRERGVRGLRALGAAQPLRDLDRAEAARVELRGGAQGAARAVRPGAPHHAAAALGRRWATRPTTSSSTPTRCATCPRPSYHWHIEVMPALTQVAGFEWGSGFHINPVPPEEAAEFLRKVVA